MKDNNKPDLHLFTTNHPYFIELGLGSFTTGTLIDWWNQRTADGRYLNRRHINFASSPLVTLQDPPNGLNALLGIYNNTEFYWDGWKPNLNIDNAGRFKRQNLYGMLGNIGGNAQDSWVFQGKTSYNLNQVADLSEYPPVVTVDLNGEIYSTRNTDYYEELKSLGPIYNLIQMNKYISSYENYYPREVWDDNTPESLPGSWALINEIRGAKGNPCIRWSGPVTFFVSENNGLLDQCAITENIEFTLYLTDESMISSENKAVTLKNMTFVGPKRDSLGAAGSSDGERIAINTQNPANQTAGEVDLQWNPVSKKWQSGNVNMLAKLVTSVGPAKAPDLTYLLDADIKEMLEDPENKYSYIPARGSGMPIRTQNSMPLQWSPNYAQTEDARCSTGSKEKQIVPVYNFNAKRIYAKGEEVLLTLIDDIWHITSLGEDNLDQQEVVPVDIGKWGSFSYLMTSSQFFFKARKSSDNSHVSVTPRSAELNFHKRFYRSYNFLSEEFLLNGLLASYGPSGNESLNIKPIGGYNFSQPFDTSTHEIWYDEPGWLQTTSFDFLDKQIFGIRDGACSISSTSATLNAAGNVIPFDNNEYPFRNSAHTGTFFGCVFPNGYLGTDIYDPIFRTWSVIPAASGQISETEIAKYLSRTDTRIDNPFENDQSRNVSNAKCISTLRDPLAPIANIEENLWERGNTSKDANMFQIDAAGFRKTIPADVMLNASPSGKNGSPIKPLTNFTPVFSKNGSFFNNSNGEVAKLLECGIWLSRQDDGQPIDFTKSAFDFEPVKRDALMFRPLKLESYLQFGNPNFTTTNDAQNLTLDFCRKDIKGFYAEARRTTTDSSLPVSDKVFNRERNNTIANIAGHETGNLLEVLKWGIWTSGKPFYNRLHRFNYWDTDYGRGALAWVNIPPISDNAYVIDENANWNGAGAFGVITTSNKVRANSRIEFTTKNLYGMSPAAHGRFSLAGYDYQDRTWGVGNFIESYKQENIADLSVRIYQGHPEHLTLYDPRYFAVHHFNEGVAFLNDKYYGNQTIPVNTLGQQYTMVRNALKEPFKTLRNQNGVLLTNVNYIYPQASGVDVKVPSRYAVQFHEENNDYKPQALSIGDKLFVDATQDSNGNLLPPLMSEKYWQVNTKRTGKLLPYKYTIPTFSIPQNFTTLVTEESVKGQTVLDNADKLIVKSYGKNHKKGDAIGILDYGVILVVDNDQLAENDPFTLSIERAGSGIPLDFVRSTTDKIGDFSSKFTLQTLTGQGEGFEAYFVCSQLINTITCDPKPFLIKRDGNEINRIAANVSGPRNATTGYNAAAEGESYVADTETTAFDIPTILRSEDSTYDVFFHFHNDISMTWLSCGSIDRGLPFGDFNNVTESTEQYISIEGINLQ